MLRRFCFLGSFAASIIPLCALGVLSRACLPSLLVVGRLAWPKIKIRESELRTCGNVVWTYGLALFGAGGLVCLPMIRCWMRMISCTRGVLTIVTTQRKRDRVERPVSCGICILVHVFPLCCGIHTEIGREEKTWGCCSQLSRATDRDGLDRPEVRVFRSILSVRPDDRTSGREAKVKATWQWTPRWQPGFLDPSIGV